MEDLHWIDVQLYNMVSGQHLKITELPTITNRFTVAGVWTWCLKLHLSRWKITAIESTNNVRRVALDPITRLYIIDYLIS